MAYYLSRLLYLLIGLFGISLVLLFHEGGHFLMARLLKIDVEVFSIGMGPKLFSIQGRRTELRLSLIPFGGYCSMKGSTDLTKALKDEARAFKVTEQGSYFGTTPLVRFMIFLAGPLANFLLACILFGLTAVIPVETIVHEARIVPAYLYERMYPDVIEQKTLKERDLVLECNGTRVNSWQELETLIHASRGEDLELLVDRDGSIFKTTIHSRDGKYGLVLYEDTLIGRVVEPSQFEVGDRIVEMNGVPVTCSLGVYDNARDINSFKVERDGRTIIIEADNYPFAWKTELEKRSQSTFLAGALTGAVKAKDNFFLTLHSLFQVVTRRGRNASEEITGPAKAASSIGSITLLGMKTSFASGFRAFIYLLAIVSISLCVANLLPLPSFDGGQMLVNLLQMITRRDMSPRAYVVFHFMGLGCTLLIMIAMYSLTIRDLLGI